MRKMKLSQKQQNFALRVFEAKETPGPIYFDIYTVKSMGVASAAATRLLKTVKVEAFIQELRQRAEDASIANVVERKQRLTVIMREDNFGKFGINRTSNISAADLLNKMDKIYAEGNVINIDNRKQVINVLNLKSKKQTERLIEGERTE